MKSGRNRKSDGSIRMCCTNTPNTGILFGQDQEAFDSIIIEKTTLGSGVPETI